MFEHKKIIQIITYLLSLNNNKLNLLKLMKELYLIDRLSISERDTSLSGDIYVSMPHGPVLSITLNLIRDDYFKKYIKQIPAKYFPDIELAKSAGDDLLSEKDKEYINAISSQFKKYTPKQLEKYTHNLKEWVDPLGSSIKIRYQDIMKALGRSDEEIKQAKLEYEQMSNLSQLLGN